MKGNILQQITERTKNFEKRYSFEHKAPSKEMSMREMMGVMRKRVNEAEEGQRKVSQSEIDREEEKFRNYFADDGVTVDFYELLIEPQGVLWGGNVNGQLAFAYFVYSAEAEKSDPAKKSRVEVQYLNGFDPTNPENDKLVKKVQDYYNTFKQYWIDNQLELNPS